jgi:ABC-type bacteriocin/lantibiotic exporter with double-glycine peptidase domain
MKFINAVTSKDKNGMLLFLAVNLSLWILSQLAFYLNDYALGIGNIEAWKSLLSKTYRTVSDYDPHAYQKKPFDIQQELGQNYEIIKQYILEFPVTLILYFVYIIGIVVILLSFSLPITLLVVISIPAVILLSSKFQKKLYQVNDDYINCMKEDKQLIDERFKLTVEERFIQRTDQNILKCFLTAFSQKGKRKVKVESFFSNILSYALLNLIILLTTIISGFQVYYGILTIGALYALELYVSRFWTPVEFLVDFFKGYLSIKPMVTSMQNFIDYPVAAVARKPIDSLEIRQFTSLDQKYKPLHQPVTQSFEKGIIYAITGENGSGKTTLAESLLGLTDRYTGEIVMNHAIMEQSRILSDAAYVPAKPFISQFFDDPSIISGSYGQQKKYQVKKIAGMSKTLFIFDEPTNFLDAANHDFIYDVLLKLKEKGKIVMIITHDQALIDQLGAVNIQLSSLETAQSHR